MLTEVKAIGEVLRDFCAARDMTFLLDQWDAVKNAPLTPDAVTFGSRRKVWWRCGAGHSWQAAVFSRAREGCGCPYCTGRRPIPGKTDLAACFPALADQWDGEKNGTLAPEDVTANSNRAVWWRCARGHSYRATVAHRTRAESGCPYCAGRRVLTGFNDLATLYPKVAEQWHSTLNGALTPEMVTAGSHQPVWWQCGEGHVWKAKVYSRTDARQCGCPICAGKFRKTM